MSGQAGANLEVTPPQMKPINTAQLSAIQRLSRFLHLDIPEVWVRFLLAIVGLTLAFGAALFPPCRENRETSGRLSFWPRPRCCWRLSWD